MNIKINRYKKSYAIIFTLITVVLFNACDKKLAPYCGKVHFICKEYDSLNKDLNVKVSMFPEFYGWWYKDSFAIEEIKKLVFITENNIRTVSREFIYYQFVDIKAASFYLYHNFSDTASFFEKFDASNKNIAGTIYPFYLFKKNVLSSVKLTDTIINDIKFSKHQYFNKEDTAETNETIVLFEMYGRKRTLFDFGWRYSPSFSYAIKRQDILNTKEIPDRVSWEINFDRDSLTQEEHKVFAAWAKKAIENPLTKKAKKKIL